MRERPEPRTRPASQDGRAASLDAYSAERYPSAGARYTGYVGGYPGEDPARLEPSRAQPGGHYGKGPRSFRRDDRRILEEVCEVLAEHPQLDAGHMEVSVADGVVFLQGFVTDRHDKRLAEDLTEPVHGVRDVRNHLRVAQDRAH